MKLIYLWMIIMAAITPQEQAIFNQTNYAHHGYLYVSEPNVVFEATVKSVIYRANGIEGYRYETITYGAITDVKQGMTFELSNSGIFSGSNRVRLDGTSGSDVIYVGRSSEGIRRGELNRFIGNKITIYDDVQVWSKQPYIDNTGAQYKDGIAFPGADLAQPPVCNIGSDELVLTSDGSNVTITLDALGDNPSFTVRDGATIASYEWDLSDGTVATGTLTSSQLTATFPRGERYVRCTVTDSNGASHTASKFVVNATIDDCVECEISSHKITRQGTELSLRFDGSELTTIREQTKILFVQHASWGDYGNEYIRFSGWVGEHNYTLNASNNGTVIIEITCYDIGRRLKELFSFSFDVRNTTTSASWYEMEDTNPDRLMHRILQFSSTALDHNDFVWSGLGATYPMPSFSTGGVNFYDQLSILCQSIAHEFTVRTDGTMQIIPDAIVQPSLEQYNAYNVPVQRTDVVRLTVTTDNYTQPEFTFYLPTKTLWHRAEAISSGGNPDNITAYFSVAPGAVPAQGSVSVTDVKQLVTSQDELNCRTGNRYNARSNPIIGLLTVDMVNTWPVIEPADMEWITLIPTQDMVDRYDRNVLGDRYLPVSVTNSYNHQSGIVETQWELEPEIVGLVAKTEAIDPGQADQQPDYFDGELEVDIVDINTDSRSGIATGSDNLVAIMSNGTIAVTSNAQTSAAEGGPDWTVYDHSATIGSDLIAFHFDPSAGGDTDGWILTPDEIIYGTNLHTASPSFTVQHTFSSSTIYRNMDVQWRFAPGAQLIVASHYAVPSGSNVINRIQVITSEDGGTTWSSEVTPEWVHSIRTDIMEGLDAGALSSVPGVLISPDSNRYAWVGGRIDYGSDGNNDLTNVMVSGDYFDNWVTAFAFRPGAELNFSGLQSVGHNDLANNANDNGILSLYTQSYANVQTPLDSSGNVVSHLSGSIDSWVYQIFRQQLAINATTNWYDAGSSLPAPIHPNRTFNGGWLTSDDNVSPSPLHDHISYGLDPFRGKGTLGTPRNNPYEVLMVGAAQGNPPTHYGLFITKDFSNAQFLPADVFEINSSWVTLVEPSTSVKYRRVHFLNNGEAFWAYGLEGALAYSDTPFEPSAIDNRTGDLSTSAEIIGLSGYS